MDLLFFCIAYYFIIYRIHTLDSSLNPKHYPLIPIVKQYYSQLLYSKDKLFSQLALKFKEIEKFKQLFQYSIDLQKSFIQQLEIENCEKRANTMKNNLLIKIEFSDKINTFLKFIPSTLYQQFNKSSINNIITSQSIQKMNNIIKMEFPPIPENLFERNEQMTLFPLCLTNTPPTSQLSDGSQSLSQFISNSSVITSTPLSPLSRNSSINVNYSQKRHNNSKQSSIPTKKSKFQ